MDPKNHSIEKENHLPNLHFWVQHVNSPGCTVSSCSFWNGCSLVWFGTKMMAKGTLRKKILRIPSSLLNLDDQLQITCELFFFLKIGEQLIIEGF